MARRQCGNWAGSVHHSGSAARCERVGGAGTEVSEELLARSCRLVTAPRGCSRCRRRRSCATARRGRPPRDARDRRREPHALLAGWVQFGYRFSLDSHRPAHPGGARGRAAPGRPRTDAARGRVLVAGLIVASVAVQAWGSPGPGPWAVSGAARPGPPSVGPPRPAGIRRSPARWDAWAHRDAGARGSRRVRRGPLHDAPGLGLGTPASSRPWRPARHGPSAGYPSYVLLGWIANALLARSGSRRCG